MPLYLLYLLQPLNIACFSPLKYIYSDEILALAHNWIIHITKKDFLPAFKIVYNKAFIEDNIQAGFRGAGLVPLNLDVVISKLNIQLCTPTPPTP